MLITPAFAQAADPAAGGSPLTMFIPMILIIAIMYFLVLRPQQKRLKEHRDMVSAIRRNDIVVTAGGLIGKVVKVSSDTEIVIEIAENVRVRAIKGTIAEVRTKTEPVRDKRREEPEDEPDDEIYDDEDDAEDTRKPAKAAERPAPVPASKAASMKSQPVKKGKPQPPSKRPGKPAPSQGAETSRTEPAVVRENGAAVHASDTNDASKTT